MFHMAPQFLRSFVSKYTDEIANQSTIRKTGKRLPLIVGDDSSGSIFRNITTAFIYKRTRIGTSFVNISSQALRPSINRKSIATPNSVHHGGNPPGYPRRFKPSSSSRYQEMMRGTSNGSFSVPATAFSLARSGCTLDSHVCFRILLCRLSRQKS